MKRLLVLIIISIFALGITGCDLQELMKQIESEEDIVKKGKGVSLSKKTLRIPEGTTTINESQFDFRKFTSLVIPKSVKIIKKRAFYNHNFDSIVIEGTDIIIEDDAFLSVVNKFEKVMVTLGTSLYNNIANMNGKSNISNDEMQKSLKRVFGNVRVKYQKVNDKSLSEQQTEKVFVIPNGVNKIYDYWSSSLGEGVLYLYDSNIKPYLIPNGSTGIRDNTGTPINASNRDRILGDSMKYPFSYFEYAVVGDNYKLWKSATSVKMPNTLRIIGGGAFSNGKLLSIDIPNSVENIEARAFYSNYIGLKVVIPRTVKKIGFRAFESNKLTSITIENPKIQIDNRSFYDNPLEEVTLPKKLFDTIVQENRLTIIFGNRNIIYRVTGTDNDVKNVLFVKQGTTTIAKSQYASRSLDEVILPHSLLFIEDRAFANNRLKSITFPASLTSIGYAAFIKNEFTSLILPKNIERVSYYAFSANKITSVTLFNSAISFSGRIFGYNTELKTVILPRELYLEHRYLKYKRVLSLAFGKQVVFYKDHEGTRYYENDSGRMFPKKVESKSTTVSKKLDAIEQKIEKTNAVSAFVRKTGELENSVLPFFKENENSVSENEVNW